MGGCAPALNRSYSSLQPHPQYSDADKASGYLRAENYHQLVSAILFLVSQGDESGIIRLYDYTGSADEDLDTAYREVMETDPFGAWALDYINYTLQKTASYYEVELSSIAYRRTAEQRAAVVSVTGVRALNDEASALFLDYLPAAAYRVGYFEPEISPAQLEAMFLARYYETPESAVGRPEITARLYPAESSGRQRMVEITLHYPATQEELRARKEALAQRTSALLRQLGQGGDAREKLLRIQQLLAETVSLAEDPQRNHAYAALVEGEAAREGIALAAQLLCQKQGIPCKLMFGTWQGERTVWLSVSIAENQWLHWNPAVERGALQLHDDAAMRAQGYSGWQ